MIVCDDVKCRRGHRVEKMPGFLEAVIGGNDTLIVVPARSASCIGARLVTLDLIIAGSLRAKLWPRMMEYLKRVSLKRRRADVVSTASHFTSFYQIVRDLTYGRCPMLSSVVRGVVPMVFGTASREKGRLRMLCVVPAAAASSPLAETLSP